MSSSSGTFDRYLIKETKKKGKQKRSRKGVKQYGKHAEAEKEAKRARSRRRTVIKKQRAALLIQYVFRRHRRRKARKEMKAWRRTMLIIKVQSKWRRFAARKRAKREDQFIRNVGIIVKVQRIVRQRKVSREKAWKQARKRSTQFRWDMVKARFRDAVGTEEGGQIGSKNTSKAFNLARKRRVCSTVFLHTLEDIQDMKDVSLVYTGNHVVAKKSAHIKCFVLAPTCEIHSTYQRLISGRRVSDSVSLNVELLYLVTYYADPSASHMIKIGERDLETWGHHPGTFNSLTSEHQEGMCKQVCETLLNDGEHQLASMLRTLQSKYLLNDDEVNKFSRCFSEIDSDCSGQIELEEFCEYFDLTSHREHWLARKIFRLFDKDGSLDIDQVEFICGAMEYCSMDLNTLNQFAFDMFDEDGDGSISKNELKSALSYIHNTLDLAEPIMQIMEEIKFPVGSSNFREYSKMFPALLLPAWKMQQKLRDACLGDEYWTSYTQRVRDAGRDTATNVAGMDGSMRASIIEVAVKTAWLAERRAVDEAEGEIAATMAALGRGEGEEMPVAQTVAFLRRVSVISWATNSTEEEEEEAEEGKVEQGYDADYYAGDSESGDEDEPRSPLLEKTENALAMLTITEGQEEDYEECPTVQTVEEQQQEVDFMHIHSIEEEVAPLVPKRRVRRARRSKRRADAPY
jgi:Ca2+-binding EF-hand superfamily protein